MAAPRHIRTPRPASGLLYLMLLLSVPAPSAHAEDGLGRLFFTPERRQILDRQRQMNIQTRPETPEDPTLTINGVVARSSGKRTVWINGVAQNENDLPGDVSVIPNRKEPARVIVNTGQASTANARIGETINRTTGEASDLLGDGTITRTRPRNSTGK